MIIGIDIGTSYSSVCMLGKNGEAVPVDIATGLGYGDKYSLPSAVFLEEKQGDNTLLIGQAAMNSRAIKPSRFRMEFKRLLGQKFPVMLGESQFMPEEFYTEFFRHMKKCVEKISIDKNIDMAYITYPASFDKVKKEKIEWAAHMAGFNEITLVDEPTAAAMSYPENLYDNMKLLVYDFGGGTFDASLLEYRNGIFRLLAEPAGIENCGGSDIDRLIFKDIAEHIDKEVLDMVSKKPENKIKLDSRIAEAAVKIKHQLTSASVSKEYIPIGFDDMEYTLTTDELNQMIAGMVGQTVNLCRTLLIKAEITEKDLSAVLMVGGTSRIPLVQSMVKQFAGTVPVFCSQDLELAVARGAVAYESLKKSEYHSKEIINTKEKEKKDNSIKNDKKTPKQFFDNYNNSEMRKVFNLSVSKEDFCCLDLLHILLNKSENKNMSDKAKQRFVLDKEKLPFLEIYAGWNGKIDGIEKMALIQTLAPTVFTEFKEGHLKFNNTTLIYEGGILNKSCLRELRFITWEEFVRGTIHLGKNNDIYLDDKIFDSRIFDRRYTADEAEVLCGFYKELQAFLKA